MPVPRKVVWNWDPATAWQRRRAVHRWVQGSRVGADDWVEGCCDNRLEPGGSALISEPALWGMLLEDQLGCVDWVVRKDQHGDRLWAHLCGEFWGDLASREIAQVVERRLRAAADCRQAALTPALELFLPGTPGPKGN
jgi:hypothetical protein